MMMGLHTNPYAMGKKLTFGKKKFDWYSHFLTIMHKQVSLYRSFAEFLEKSTEFGFKLV